MADSAEYVIGSPVACVDGPCGELRRVVIDPVARTLTHLAVDPPESDRPERVVPIDLVQSAGQEIELRCTRADFEALEVAQETYFLPGGIGEWGYKQWQMLSLPYFGLGRGDAGIVGSVSARPHTTTYDRVPLHEVEVRRGEHVHAVDGDVGRVQGLVIDPADRHVTHVLLDEGHLWGAKRVAIPISAVVDVRDGVRVNLTKHSIGELPAVELD